MPTSYFYRHNGVVIEPSDAMQEEDEPSPREAGPSESRSSSRSGSPAESVSSEQESSEPKHSVPSASTSSRSSSYYRPHTMHIGLLRSCFLTSIFLIS